MTPQFNLSATSLADSFAIQAAGRSKSLGTLTLDVELVAAGRSPDFGPEHASLLKELDKEIARMAAISEQQEIDQQVNLFCDEIMGLAQRKTRTDTSERVMQLLGRLMATKTISTVNGRMYYSSSLQRGPAKEVVDDQQVVTIVWVELDRTHITLEEAGLVRALAWTLGT